MRTRAWVPLLMIVAGTTCAGMLAAAVDKPTQQPPTMSPEEQAMMQKWQAFMTPGEPHKLLAAKAGSWSTKVTMWPAPGAPPSTSDGTSDFKMILDGRYLQETAQGTFQGMPFVGHGVTGFDNLKQKFVSSWFDNMSTGIMIAEGTYDPATKTWTYSGEGPDVMAGEHKPMKSIEKTPSPDQSIVEVYNQTPDGKGWWKSMEMVYTRTK